MEAGKHIAVFLLLSTSCLLNQEADASSDKRQGLLPFPRVGRSGNSDPRMMRPWMLQDNSKPSGSASASSPWFGPRLGRSQRRFDAAGPGPDSPWTLLPASGLQRGLRGRSPSFTPRLGRELDLGIPMNDMDDEELRPTGL